MLRNVPGPISEPIGQVLDVAYKGSEEDSQSVARKSDFSWISSSVPSDFSSVSIVYARSEIRVGDFFIDLECLFAPSRDQWESWRILPVKRELQFSKPASLSTLEVDMDASTADGDPHYFGQLWIPPTP